jgi:hypothetical protein
MKLTKKMYEQMQGQGYVGFATCPECKGAVQPQFMAYHRSGMHGVSWGEAAARDYGEVFDPFLPATREWN